MLGSASPETSGTPRPPPEAVGAGTLRPCCQVGSGKRSLTPPPVAPSLAAVSFQTTSLVIVEPEPSSLVPPQQRTLGLEPGKSTWLAPSVTPSVEPLSPAATVMVTPSAAAAWQAASSAFADCAVQVDSGPPQEMEMTEGLLVVSWTAVEMASMKPWSVLGVK